LIHKLINFRKFGKLSLRRLSRREKISVSIASILVGIIVFVQFILFPVLDEKTRLERTVQTKTDALKEIQRLKADYQSLVKSAEQFKRQTAARPEGFTLFAFLDKLAGDTGIKNNIAYMKPSSTTQKNMPYKISVVEMKLQDVTLEQLTRYLYGMETSPNMVTLRRASFIKKGDNGGTIDAVLQVETIQV